jgi:hypothetical protein
MSRCAKHAVARTVSCDSCLAQEEVLKCLREGMPTHPKFLLMN